MPDAVRSNLEGDGLRRGHDAGIDEGARPRTAFGETGAWELEAPEVLADDVAARDRLVDWLRVALWRREAALATARDRERALKNELDAVVSSTSWRISRPFRIVGGRYPRIATLLRRTAKVVYWTVTLELSGRLRARRENIESARRIEFRAQARTYETWIESYDTLASKDVTGMRTLIETLEDRPLVSVLMPVFNPPERFLREAIESVRAQVYEEWELCVADDASTAEHVRPVIEEYAGLDDRIRVMCRDVNGGISAASNSALALARGEVAALLDHDDLLRPHALLLAVLAFAADPRVTYVYSDEDKVDADGRRFAPWFKPDWNPALLLSQNYLCHFSVFRTALARQVGGFRSEYDGSQDWDLAFRMTESLEPEAIAHVPHVLYHWRAFPGSAAADPSAKRYAVDTARHATEDHLARTGRQGCVLPAGTHVQKVRYLPPPPPPPLVSAIVPSTGRPDLVEPCLDGLLHGTAYERLEVILAVSEETYEDPTRRRCIQLLAQDSRVRVVALPPAPFNFAATVNKATLHANGDLLLLLNDDTEVISEDWLEAMVGYALLDRVGAVGGLLLYPDETIQSAGMLVGARGVAEHLYSGRPLGIAGYMGRARLAQDLTVVAGTCMLINREAFTEMGGMDESFPVCYNDVDFCLKLRSRGWRVLLAPDAVLYHHETASFGTHQRGRDLSHQADVARMIERWGSVLLDDPMHNPNLALDASDPSLLAFPPRVTYPWRSTAAIRSARTA